MGQFQTQGVVVPGKRLRKATLWPSYQGMDASTVAFKTGAASRLPADARIGRVRLRVGDLGRALELYRDVLGLEVARDEGARITLAPPGSTGEPGLIILEEQAGITRRPARPVSTGLYHVALLVPSRRDLGRSLLRLHQSGYPLRGMSDHAVSESLYLDDPYGNGLEIYADRPRTAWPIQDGVVQMTVDPMDAEGVIAAGRERPEPWNGLPADTVVGHIHLTVSQMERAVAFYRDVIGFDVMMRIPSLTAVSAGGYHHHLNLNTWAGEGAPPDSDRVAGLLGWELVVPDSEERRALIGRLGAAGALTGPATAATASDPDRIPIELEPVS